MVRLLLAPARRRQFREFSYLHQTMVKGRVVYGGLETGLDDPDWRATVATYEQRFASALTGDLPVELRRFSCPQHEIFPQIACDTFRADGSFIRKAPCETHVVQVDRAPVCHPSPIGDDPAVGYLDPVSEYFEEK